MSKQRFDELTQQRAALKAWWSLGTTTAKYDGEYHKLRVDVQPVGITAFCGQAYAGANNYHDAPAFFKEKIQAVLQAEVLTLAERAYTEEMERLTAEIGTHKAAILAELESPK